MDWPYIRSSRLPRLRDTLTGWTVVGLAAFAGAVVYLVLFPVVFAMFLHDERHNYDNIDGRE